MENSSKMSIIAFESPSFGPERVRCETSLSFINMEDVLYEAGDFDYSFGDFVSFPYSTYNDRESNIFIIGKNNQVYKINDKKMYDNWVIPYEITKYIKNAFLKFDNYINRISKIHLRYDDTFIRKNINTKKYKILKDWKILLSLKDNKITIHFDDTTFNTFDLNKINASKINYWYESSKLEQSKLEINLHFPNNLQKKFKKNLLFFKTNLPFTWTLQENNVTYQEGYINKNYILSGPKLYEKKVIKSIHKLFNYFNLNFDS